METTVYALFALFCVLVWVLFVIFWIFLVIAAPRNSQNIVTQKKKPRKGGGWSTYSPHPKGGGVSLLVHPRVGDGEVDNMKLSSQQLNTLQVGNGTSSEKNYKSRDPHSQSSGRLRWLKSRNSKSRNSKSRNSKSRNPKSRPLLNHNIFSKFS